MPTSTFFRLPEEKRKRLMDAAWEEFTTNSYTDASINRIIQKAHIPRGSFYQYFQDKEDLFWYLFGGMHDYFAEVFRELLQESKGDLFAVPIQAFDRFVSRRGDTDPILTQCIQVMRLNQGLDFQRFCAVEPGMLPEEFMSCIHLDNYRRRDREFISHVFFMSVAPLAFAIMETLRNPDQWERQRNILQERIEVVRAGSLSPEGNAACVHQQQGGEQC